MAFILLTCIVMIAAGFGVLHHALLRRTRELQCSGWTLVIGGICVAVMALWFPSSLASLHSSQAAWSGPYGKMKGHRDWKQCPVDEHKGEGKMTLEAPPPPTDHPKAKPAAE